MIVRPELASRRDALERELGEPMTLDGLTRDFVIFQRRRGHRHSTDDLLTAWYAVVHAPKRGVASILDLGSGIGSVGLSVAWRFPEARLTAVEVQDGSFVLLGENVRANRIESRVDAIHGDLREVASELGAASFDLVTGSPPYFDVRAGIVSPDPQRAAARFELCGDVGDYCRAARRTLAPGGVFVFCFPTTQRARAEKACADASLAIFASRDVVPKHGLAPLFSLFACAAEDAPPAPPVREPLHTVRDARGAPTPEHLAARAIFGMT